MGEGGQRENEWITSKKGKKKKREENTKQQAEAERRRIRKVTGAEKKRSEQKGAAVTKKWVPQRKQIDWEAGKDIKKSKNVKDRRRANVSKG